MITKTFPVVFLADALKCFVCSSDKLEICLNLHTGSIDESLPHELCAQNVTSCFTSIKSM